MCLEHAIGLGHFLCGHARGVEGSIQGAAGCAVGGAVCVTAVGQSGIGSWAAGTGGPDCFGPLGAGYTLEVDGQAALALGIGPLADQGVGGGAFKRPFGFRCSALHPHLAALVLLGQGDAPQVLQVVVAGVAGFGLQQHHHRLFAHGAAPQAVARQPWQHRLSRSKQGALGAQGDPVLLGLRIVGYAVGALQVAVHHGANLVHAHGHGGHATGHHRVRGVVLA